MTATDTQPFLLDYFAVNGRLVERLPDTERGIDLHEWTTWLRVRSNAILVAPRPPADDDATGFVPPAFLDDGLAVLVVVRSHHDLEGRSIGVFHDRLPADEVELLRRAVELTPWPELPRPAGGHVAAPELRIEYSSGSTLIRRAYNARSGNFRAAIQPLEQIINGHLSRLLNRPAGTLALEVDAEHPDKNNPKDFTLRVNFVNKGSGPIALTDPRILPPNADPIAAANRFFDGVHPRLELHVGELESEIPDAWPPRWTALPLPDMPDGAPRTLTLASRSNFELSVPWRAPKPGRYLVRAAWRDYDGPLDLVNGQLPFMPLPTRGPCTLSGPYPVRGAAFASRAIEVPADSIHRRRKL